jgi:hypothetical protein
MVQERTTGIHRRKATAVTLGLLVLAVTVQACTRNASSADAEKVVIVFEEIDDVLPNPFKGFAPWTGAINPVYETTLSKATVSWRTVHPAPDRFVWDAFEADWPEVGSGRRVGFRFAAAYPGREPVGIPDWLVDQGVRMSPYEIDGKAGLAPDWDDPRFIEAHRLLLRALGERYNDDPRVGWVEVGSYGFWGEWHVWRNEHLAGTLETRHALIDHYLEAFPDKPLVIAFDDDFATKYVTERGGGIRNDCLGRASSNDWYLRSIDRIDPSIHDRVWRGSIMTGEFCGGARGAIEGTTEHFDSTLAFVKRTHLSFIGPAGGAIQPQSEAHRRNLDLLHRTLGYRFVLRSAELPSMAGAGSELAINLQLENIGIAPFYFAWPLVLSLHDESGQQRGLFRQEIDIRTWLPGQHRHVLAAALPPELEAGAYTLKLAIIDPASDAPGIRFANPGRDAEGRYPLATFHVY